MNNIPPIHACKIAILKALRHLGDEGRRADIVALAERLGSFSAAERATPAPASKSNYGTYLAYNLSWAITHLHKEGAIERVAPQTWRIVK